MSLQIDQTIENEERGKIPLYIVVGGLLIISSLKVVFLNKFQCLI